MFQSHQAERAVRICAALIERVRHAQRIAHPIHIAFDEWNVWYRTRSHEDRVGGVEERYNLSDALAVATYLNGFIRHCRTVRIANFAQLVNAIAPIFTSREGLFLQTIYHPLRLYAEHTLAVALDVHVDGETYDLPPAQEAERRRPRPSRGRPRAVPAARRRRHLRRRRAASWRSPSSTATATATCRPRSTSAGAADRGRRARRGRSTAPTSSAINSFETPRAVDVRERALAARGAGSTLTLPAHSITVLRFDIRRP